MNDKRIRWQQRFTNFEKAFLQFQSGIMRIDKLDDIGKEGLIQRFEYTFELAWKTLKDYLESQGIPARYPREVIKSAWQTQIIDNGELWMEMLEDRNLMAHTYDEQNFKKALRKINDFYYKQIQMLYAFLKDEQ